VLLAADPDEARPLVDRGCVTCLGLGLVLTLTLVAGGLALYPRLTARVVQGFAAVLETQARAQARYRAAALRDDDSDGQGEYLFIADMPPPATDPDGEPDPSFGIAPQLRAAVAEAGGIADLGAYRLQVHLPGPDGTWVADDGRRPPPAPPAVASARSRAFIIYAWPDGAPGDQVLVIDQRGVVYAAPATGAPSYDATHAPAADAAYATPGAALDAPPLEGRPARDGRVWRRYTPPR
jgi:hypothetical protein